MVDQRGEDVAEQDGEHHAFGVARVEEAHGDAERADQEAVDPLAGLGLGGGHRVGRHEDDAEGEAAVEQLHVAGDRGDAGQVADAAHEEGAQHAGAHDLPAGDARPDQEDGAEQDGDHGRLTDGAGDRADEEVPETGAVLRGGAVQRERGGAGEAVHELLARFVVDPAAGAGHIVRIGEEEESARQDRRVDDVHARAAEDLLAEDDRERDGDREHP